MDNDLTKEIYFLHLYLCISRMLNLGRFYSQLSHCLYWHLYICIYIYIYMCVCICIYLQSGYRASLSNWQGICLKHLYVHAGFSFKEIDLQRANNWYNDSSQQVESTSITTFPPWKCLRVQVTHVVLTANPIHLCSKTE
jgi:hypothetical protein